MNSTQKQEYLAPELESIQVITEKGFAQTGAPGHAGDDFGTGNNWEL